jgi:methylated-DNA-[protein]-cysteine S-methyltransferase
MVGLFHDPYSTLSTTVVCSGRDAPGRNLMIVRHALLSTLAGPLLVTATEAGLRHLRVLPESHDYRPELARLWPTDGPEAALREEPRHFLPLARQLGEYFCGLRREFDLPLDPVGTAFQLEVWRRISRVPFGHLATFRDLANAVGRPEGARAVGQAVAQNPLPLLIPSHRVVGVTGRLKGFLAGNDLKARLLRLEGHTLNGAEQIRPPQLF